MKTCLTYRMQGTILSLLPKPYYSFQHLVECRVFVTSFVWACALQNCKSLPLIHSLTASVVWVLGAQLTAVVNLVIYQQLHDARWRVWDFVFSHSAQSPDIKHVEDPQFLSVHSKRRSPSIPRGSSTLKSLNIYTLEGTLYHNRSVVCFGAHTHGWYNCAGLV
jgi:hypothetical protein